MGVQNDEDEEDEEGPTQDHGGGERKADFAREKTKNKKVMHQEKKISRIRAFFYLVREDEVGMLHRPFSGLFHSVYPRFNTPYFHHNYYTSSYRNMRGMDSWASCFAH